MEVRSEPRTATAESWSLQEWQARLQGLLATSTRIVGLRSTARRSAREKDDSRIKHPFPDVRTIDKSTEHTSSREE